MSPATSENQREAACMALAMKRGKIKTTKGTPAGKMAESMTEDQLKDYCQSRVQGK